MTIDTILQRARPDIREMTGYSSARSLHGGDKDMICLDANECPFVPFPGGDGLNRYPDQQPVELRAALARLYDVAPGNLLVTRGADEAIDVLVRSFCAAGTDAVITCPPTFPMYEQAACLQSALHRAVPLDADFHPDTQAILDNVDDRVKIIFLCRPNNPTGTCVAHNDIVQLCTQCADTALIVIDETYIEFAEQASASKLVEDHPNLVVLRTLSKAYAAAGLRCGAAIGHSQIIDLLARVLAPYPVPQPVVQHAIQILRDDNLKRITDKRAELLKRRNWLKGELAALDMVDHVYDSAANFLLVKVGDAAAFCATCREHGILVRDQSGKPGLDNHVRITVGAQHELDTLLAVLRGKDLPAQGNQRSAAIARQTKETAISCTVNLDADTPVAIDTGIGFFDHMLEQLARHGGFALSLECNGDLHIDNHHTVEDCAIALGQALKQALGDKRGIARYGFVVPMDEARAEAVIDLSGRGYLVFEADFADRHIGDMPVDMIEHIFRSIAENLQATIHITVYRGANSHHMAEACFKALARVLRQAIARERETQTLPSTKEAL